MPYNQQGKCWHCGHSLQHNDYAREGCCPVCGKHTHVCRNCRFFDPGAPSQCSEPIADHVAAKDRSNFCGYFEASSNTSGASTPDTEKLRQAADDLFDL